MNISRADFVFSVADLNKMLRDYAPTAPDLQLTVSGGAIVLRFGSSGRLVDLRPALHLQVADVSPTRLTLTTRLVGLPLIEKLVRDRALPRALEELAVAGLTYGDGRIELDLEELLPILPVRFRLDKVSIGRGIIVVTVRDLSDAPGLAAALPGSLGKTADAGGAAVNDDSAMIPVPAVPTALATPAPTEARPLYDRIRAGVQRSLGRALPPRLARLTPWLLALPDLTVLLWRLTIHPAVDGKRKALASAALAYIVWPLDFLPDLLPGLGWLDDTTIALLSLCAIISAAPPELRASLWPGEPDAFTPLSKALDLFEQVVGKRLFGRLRDKAGL